MNLHAFFQEENPKVKLELFKNKSEEVYPLADIRIHRRKSTKTLSPLTNRDPLPPASYKYVRLCGCNRNALAEVLDVASMQPYLCIAASSISANLGNKKKAPHGAGLRSHMILLL